MAESYENEIKVLVQECDVLQSQMQAKKREIAGLRLKIAYLNHVPFEREIAALPVGSIWVMRSNSLDYVSRKSEKLQDFVYRCWHIVDNSAPGLHYHYYKDDDLAVILNDDADICFEYVFQSRDIQRVFEQNGISIMFSNGGVYNVILTRKLRKEKNLIRLPKQRYFFDDLVYELSVEKLEN